MNSDGHVMVQICHGDPMFAAGLRALFSAAPGFALFDREDAAEPAVRVARVTVDVVVADFDQGISRGRNSRMPATGHMSPEPRVLIFTSRSSEADIRCALRAGVHGYLVQGCSQEAAICAVRDLTRGVRYLCPVASKRMADSLSHETLTERESDVLELLGDGLSNKLIARRLNLAVGTVKAHIRGILAKLEARSRTHAVLVAVERGLVRKDIGTSNGLAEVSRREVLHARSSFPLHRSVGATTAAEIHV
jgi:DNA-binding NarL/FixJ family response regulator